MKNNVTIKVLIVDDETLVCRAISRILTIEGHDCTSVPSAEQALRMLDEEHFDLLVSDVLMPGISGNELLREVNKKFTDMAVVMITGNDNKETFARCFTDKGYGYLIKPFSDNQLLVSVKNALLTGKLQLENKILRERLKKISQLSDYFQ